MNQPKVTTRRAAGGGYETLIHDDAFGLVSYGQEYNREGSEIIATNRMHETRRLILMAFASGMWWLTLADVCKMTQLPTAIVQFHIRQLLLETRIVEHEAGGSYRSRRD